MQFCFHKNVPILKNEDIISYLLRLCKKNDEKIVVFL